MNFYQAMILQTYINQASFEIINSDTLQAAYASDEMAELVLGKEFCKRIGWKDLENNDKEEILQILNDVCLGEKYYGVYPFSPTKEVVGNEVTTFPTVTFETEDEAEEYFKKIVESSLGKIESPDEEIFYTISPKSPVHVQNNEIRKLLIDKLANYHSLSSEEKQKTLSFCYDEFCRYEKSPLQKIDIINSWKKELEWKKLERNFDNLDTEKYTPLSEEKILQNFEDLEKKIDELEEKYSIYKIQFENSYKNKKTVSEEFINEVRSKSTYLFEENLARKKEAAILLSSLYSYICFTGKVKDPEHPNFVEYPKLYNRLAESVERLNRIHPEYFVIGNYGIKFASEDKNIKSEKLKNFKAKLSEMLGQKYSENEQTNIVFFAKNELKNKFHDSITDRNVYYSKNEIEDAKTESEIIVTKLFKNYPYSFHEVYDFLNKKNPNVKEILKMFDETEFSKDFSIDKEEFSVYCQLRENYSNLLEKNNVDKIFFDDKNKNIAVATLDEGGYKVVLYDMPAYLREISKNEIEYNFGTTRTFLFDLDGNLTKVNKSHWENGMEIAKDIESKEEIKKELNFTFLGTENYHEIDVKSLNFKMGLIEDLIRGEYTAENEKTKEKIEIEGKAGGELGFSVGLSGVKPIAEVRGCAEATYEKMGLLISKIKAWIKHDVQKGKTSLAFEQTGDGKINTTIFSSDQKKPFGIDIKHKTSISQDQAGILIGNAPAREASRLMDGFNKLKDSAIARIYDKEKEQENAHTK